MGLMENLGLKKKKQQVFQYEDQDNSAAVTVSDSEPETGIDDDSEKNYSFDLLVNDAKVITGEGTLVTGEVKNGSVLRVGDKVKVVDLSEFRPKNTEPFETVEATVLSIQPSPDSEELADEVSEGYAVSILLDTVIDYDIRYIGHVVMERPEYDTKTIVVDVFTTPRDEGGKIDPMFEYYNTNFRFGDEMLKGYYTFPSDMVLIMAGDYCEEVYIHLERDIDIGIGDEYEIVENGKVIATGKVKDIK